MEFNLKSKKDYESWQIDMLEIMRLYQSGLINQSNVIIFPDCKIYHFVNDIMVFSHTDFKDKGTNVYIRDLYILPPFRGKLGGTHFLTYIEKNARKFNKETITTEPFLWSVDFFKKHGFEFITDKIMEKKLK